MLKVQLAIDHEFEGEHFGGAARNVVHRSVMLQLFKGFWFAILAQVGRAGAGDRQTTPTAPPKRRR
jgi:hypothetical protein